MRCSLRRVGIVALLCIASFLFLRYAHLKVSSVEIAFPGSPSQLQRYPEPAGDEHVQVVRVGALKETDQQISTTKIETTKSATTTTKVPLPVLDASLGPAALLQAATTWNERQDIFNADRFHLVSCTLIKLSSLVQNLSHPQAAVVVIMVHQRADYLATTIASLRAVRGIERALLVFSHDYVDQALDFAIAKVLSFPPVTRSPIDRFLRVHACVSAALGAVPPARVPRYLIFAN